MKVLPFTANTETGDQFEIEFPLHPETVDPIRVSQLASAILQQMSNEFKICGEMSNGDVLQALSMVLAIRARMIHAPEDTIHNIASGLLDMALRAASDADRNSVASGHA